MGGAKQRVDEIRIRLGADAYLVKPFEPEALRDIARRLLEGAE